MKKNLTLFVASMLMSASSFAQWEYPKHPKYGEIVYNDTVYLYNVDAKAFFLGANSYDTRASINTGKGYKCFIEQIEEGTGENIVTIKDSVETKSGMFYVFAQSEKDIWVDYNNNAGASINWKIDANGDGTYSIYNTLSSYASYKLGIKPSDSASELFLIDPVEEMVTYTRWAFVTNEDYKKYRSEYFRIETADSLLRKLETATSDYSNLNFDDETKVYNNYSSTTEELQAAINSIVSKINEYKENLYTPTNPLDITATYIPDADFERNQGAGVWKRTHSAQNYMTDNTPNKMGDATYFLEAWNGTAFTGKEYVSISDLPNGIYEFTLSAATNGGNGIFVYANSDSVEVTTGSNMTPYTVYTNVTDGKLEVGLNLPAAVQNWVGIDDAKLQYFGNSTASYQYWIKNLMEKTTKYDADNDLVQISLANSYNELLATNVDEMTKEEVLTFIEKFFAAKAEIEENVATYAKLVETMNEAQKLIDKGYEGDEANVLDSYINNANDNIIDIKGSSTEEVNAEITKITEQIQIVTTNCLAYDLDCTNFLTNANFNDRLNGWTVNSKYSDVAWGGLDSNPCAERWNENFEISQTVTGIPNGVYQLNVKAFYRPVSSTTTAYENYIADPNNTDDILTYIYINSAEKKVVNIASKTYNENVQNNSEEVTSGVFVVNGMNAASEAFSNGAYENTVNGVVTDGVLTVGIKNTTGTEGGRWALWDDFRLTYKAYDSNTILEVINGYNDKISELEGSHFYEILYNEINEAYINGISNAESDNGKEAFNNLSTLIVKINEADECITVYSKLHDAINNLQTDLDTYTSADDAVMNEANEFITEANTNYNNHAYTTEQANEAINKLK
nr:hypothetical protein [Bacteroidaceae bacterium]